MNYLVFGTFGAVFFIGMIYLIFDVLGHEPNKVYYNIEEDYLYDAEYEEDGILIGDL